MTANCAQLHHQQKKLLWTKWDMNDLSFICYIMNTNRRVLVDKKDLSTQIKSSIASPTQIKQNATLHSRFKTNRSHKTEIRLNSVSSVLDLYFQPQSLQQLHSHQL